MTKALPSVCVRRKWVEFLIILELWKLDVKLVLDKQLVLVYYVPNTLER
jgi:hypothetical protein